MSSIDKHSSGDKFHLLSTVWFILGKHFIPYRNGVHLDELWPIFCIKLFQFNSTDRRWDAAKYFIMESPTEYRHYPAHRFGAIYGHIAETQRLVPEPTLSHRLACVAISCIRYLFRRDLNTPPIQDHLCAWAKKSKRMPWLWRRRLRVTSSRRAIPPSEMDWRKEWTLWSVPQSLRRLRQAFYTTRIQSEKFYQEQHACYIWALDLLYRTLRKAMKSDELIKALSNPFIPSSVPLLFPRHVRRVKKAADAYLEKVNRRAFQI